MEQPRIPRFRIVLEASFPQASPTDPSDYDKLIEHWKDTIERDEAVRCQNVQVREVLTIGDVDDYDDWRNRKGAYDFTKLPKESTGEVRGRGKRDSWR